jgi:transcriptional regulator with XRE-family HTH domain
MADLPERLRTARLAAGLTQERVARRLDVTEKTYRRWETGENPPSRATLEVLAKLFGMPVETLVEESK